MARKRLSSWRVFLRVLGWSQLFTLWLAFCTASYPQADWRSVLAIAVCAFIPTLLLALLAAWLVGRPNSRSEASE
jgi:hypothetical protein